MDFKATFLTEGKEAFPYIQKKIAEAKESISINMFIWREDSIGIQMAKSILDAADRGVKIIITKDRLGGLFELSEESRKTLFHHNMNIKEQFLSGFLHRIYPMENKGCPSKIPHQYYGKIKSHPNITLNCNDCLKDHSKFYIIDNRTLILGGINIEDKEIYTDANGKMYHDYMISIDCPHVVKHFRQRLNGESLFDPEREIDFILNRFNSEPKEYLKNNILEFINNAKKSIKITMAYLGDLEIHNALIKKAQSGVKISVMVPEKANLQHDYNLSLLKNMLQKCPSNLTIYLNPKMVHGKLVIIDESLLTFGSFNFNRQATEKLSELNIVLKMDKDLKHKVLDVYNKEIFKCKKVELLEDFPKYKKIRGVIENILS